MISVSRCAQRGASHPGNQPMPQGAHRRATPIFNRSRQAPAVAPITSQPSWPRHRLTRLISRSAPKPHLSPTSSPTRRPLPSLSASARSLTPPISRPYPASRPGPTPVTPEPCTRRPAPAPSPRPSAARRPASPPRPARPYLTRANRAQSRIRGKPFLTASNALADYSELPTGQTSRERIEGVSRSLPFSDLLALTSSHMFFSVMN